MASVPQRSGFLTDVLNGEEKPSREVVHRVSVSVCLCVMHTYLGAECGWQGCVKNVYNLTTGQ